MGSLVPSFSARTAIPGVPGQPNPPKWPNTVKVFSPRSSKIGKQLHKLYETQQAIFGDGRLAVLFKPGRYTDNVPVGYYTTVHGLGSSPEDVVFEGRQGDLALWCVAAYQCPDLSRIPALRPSASLCR